MKKMLLIIAALFISSHAMAADEWELVQKDNSAISVAEFRAKIANSPMALNLIPASNCVPLGFFGCAWLHVLNRDHKDTPNFQAAQLGVNETDVVLGSIGFGTKPALPITVRLDSAIAMFISPYETQFRNGRIIIDRQTTGIALDFKRNGVSMGRIIVDSNGPRFEGFRQIDDLLARVSALESARAK